MNGIRIARVSDLSPEVEPESASAKIFTIQKIPSANSTASNGRYAHGCTLPKASGLAVMRISSTPTTKLSIFRNVFYLGRGLTQRERDCLSAGISVRVCER